MEKIISFLKTTWGGNIVFIIIGIILGQFGTVYIDNNNITFTTYDNPQILSRFLRSITFDERDVLQDKGYFDITTLAFIHDNEIQGRECRSLYNNQNDINTNCSYYGAAENIYYSTITENNHFHVRDKQLPDAIARVVEREDKVAVGLLQLFFNGKKPFGDTIFKVAFSENLEFNEASVCRDNTFYASRPLKIRASDSLSEEDKYAVLKSINATEGCLNDGPDACLISENDDEQPYNEDSPRYSELNDIRGQYIKNVHFIRISLELAKKLYPDKFDSEGEPIYTSEAINDREAVGGENILKYCEIGYVFRQEV